MHDHRQRSISSRKYFKVSSPTLRRLCLPCLSARDNRPRSSTARIRDVQRNEDLKQQRTIAVNDRSITLNVKHPETKISTTVHFEKANLVETTMKTEVNTSENLSPNEKTRSNEENLSVGHYF